MNLSNSSSNFEHPPLNIFSTIPLSGVWLVWCEVWWGRVVWDRVQLGGVVWGTVGWEIDAGVS